MKLYEIAAVGRITKQNQTPDVGPNAVQKQAAKFGNRVDRDGKPPLLHSRAYKNTTPNRAWNLGLSESKYIIEKINPKILDPNFRTEKSVNTSRGPIKFVAYNDHDDKKSDLSTDALPRFVVDAYHNNEKIGFVRFVALNTEKPKGLFGKFMPKKDPYILAGYVRVDDEWRRKGIATAMYNFARELGNDIKRSTIQTPDGKAFWNKGAGIKESYTGLELAIMEGGHSLEEQNTKNEQQNSLFSSLKIVGETIMKSYELDEDFTGKPKAGSRPGSLKRKAAQYLGKGAGEKLSKSDLRKLLAKANKMKNSEKKSERQRGIQLSRQVSWAKNFNVTGKQ